MGKLGERGCTPIERNERKGIYSHVGRSSCGVGLEWTDDSGSRVRNRTFSEIPHSKGKRSKADAKNRPQESAAAQFDRSWGRDGDEWKPLRERKPSRELEGIRSRVGTLAIIREYGGDRVGMLERTYLHPEMSRSDHRRKLVKFLKRYGAIEGK